MRPRYYVTTWDTEKQDFTPQKGVRTGPYSLWGLRKAIRKLRGMGYTARGLGGDGSGDSSVLIGRRLA